jgi:hypothetical protein
MMPEAPVYHWNLGDVPDAAALRVTLPPLLIVAEVGYVVMDEAMMTGAVWIALMADRAAELSVEKRSSG